MSLIYYSIRTKRIVAKRYAIKNPDKVTSKEAPPSKKRLREAARAA
jgi:hypothetical protein